MIASINDKGGRVGIKGAVSVHQGVENVHQEGSKCTPRVECTSRGQRMYIKGEVSVHKGVENVHQGGSKCTPRGRETTSRGQ